MSSASAPVSEWDKIVTEHINKQTPSNKTVIVHEITGQKQFMVLRALQVMQHEINKYHNPTFMWENATKPELEAARKWIEETEGNMIKSNPNSLQMARSTLKICLAKIDATP